MTEHIARLTTAVETIFTAAVRAIGVVVGGAAFFLGIGMWLALLWFCLLRELTHHVRSKTMADAPFLAADVDHRAGQHQCKREPRERIHQVIVRKLDDRQAADG